MVRVDVRYLGELRTRAVHGPSGGELVTDAPADNHGKGEAFSPTDLVGTALGTCMLTIMGIAARRKGLALEGAEVTVDKAMSADLPRRIDRLTIRFTMPAGLSPDDRRLLERAGQGCPVHHSLHPDVTLDFTYDYPD